MEVNITLNTTMPRTLEFLCINKIEKKVIQDYSCITLTDINKELSPYLLLPKIAKDFHGVAIFPGSIVKKKGRSKQYYIIDIISTGEINFYRFPIDNPSKYSGLDYYDFMDSLDFIGFASQKLESVGHIYDELRNEYKLKIDYFKSLLELK